MFADDESPFTPRPFWFVSDELLVGFFAAEVNAVSKLLLLYPDIRRVIDAPEATLPERKACFGVLAHRALMDDIDETLIGRYVQAPSVVAEEENVFSKTQNLVATDAPAWAVEMNAVVRRLPFHIQDALPEPLRTQGYDSQNVEQVAAIKLAKDSLATVEQIQLLTAGVLDKQLQRLERRWSADAARVTGMVVPTQFAPSEAASVQSKKRKSRRKRDIQRVERDKVIAEIDEISETPEEFLRRMDERAVKPQPTWKDWPSSWVQAYKNPRFRALIHKDKSRAIKRARSGRNR